MNSILPLPFEAPVARNPTDPEDRFPIRLDPRPPASVRVAHVLRKCDPSEWGGTESALQRLMEGLRGNGVSSVVYCPRVRGSGSGAALPLSGCAIRRFRAFLPVAGLSAKVRREQIAVGGNLMSFDLPWRLWREKGLSVIHAHTFGRLGAIAARIARLRRLPFVLSVHGGLMDLPPALREEWKQSGRAGWEWGRCFGAVLGSRRLMEQVDAVLVCNPREAELLRQQYPRLRVQVQPHGISLTWYHRDHREEARTAFPMLRGRPMILCLGRMDPVKNQRWLVDEAPALLQRHPEAVMVFVGACTHGAYGHALEERVLKLRLTDRVVLAGGLPSDDPRLIGLLQEARALVLPSQSETFGLVLLEAWAAGTVVIASRTSGATALVRPGENGWLFSLDQREEFHQAVDAVLDDPARARAMAAEGRHLVERDYNQVTLAARVRQLYEELIERKHATSHSAR